MRWAELHRQAKATRSDMSMYPGKTFDDKFKAEVNKFMDQDRMGDIEFDKDTSDEEWNEHSEAEEFHLIAKRRWKSWPNSRSSRVSRAFRWAEKPQKQATVTTNLTKSLRSIWKEIRTLSMTVMKRLRELCSSRMVYSVGGRIDHVRCESPECSKRGPKYPDDEITFD